MRVKRAETVSHGPIEHALILVEDGKIVEHWDVAAAISPTKIDHR